MSKIILQLRKMSNVAPVPHSSMNLVLVSFGSLMVTGPGELGEVTPLDKPSARLVVRTNGT